ncbi:MAG TPA: hypothetical protein VOB72_04185 [Candidatus Dormibacteraeota bacterium]|nr:hypothetical protein [Candidatus Dormibacteraeota bacterium]
MTIEDPFPCICDPTDLFDPPDPTPRAIEGCPAHRARRAFQQVELRLDAEAAARRAAESTEARP